MSEINRSTEGFERYGVRLTFPEFFAQGTYKFVPDPGHFEAPNLISFTEEGHLIRIKCLSDKIRQSLVLNPVVYNAIMGTIVIPIIEKVREDLKSAAVLFVELRSKLVAKGFHDMHFYYEKTGNGYMVFDSYRMIDTQTGEPHRLFQKAMIVKALHKESVDPAYREIYKIVQSLNIEQDAETNEVYISSRDLKTAVEDALIIYLTADGLNSFPVDDAETK
ncbi:MAG: hypothetical protein ABIF85_07270 [Nanoarchaeota archaeon]|nr:hypothetical protein [Nanoarchaeota archaeon]MBU4299797.1 hypothetical protein [Nanoarchaeota archaeon]MBU4451274.1 hypothetical protein [Nanoarchaeota archaeon]MCG2724015.1 hypothetical protein [archaeon]